MYDKLLVAIDESEPAERALEQARGLAVLSKGSVQVLHVREHMVARGADWYLTDEDEAERLVDRAVAQLRAAGIDASGIVTHALHGQVADAIWDQAESAKADLVVLGSHGRTAVGGLILGSVAYRVIHLARGPVLVAR
jgi:nucleotide-binding universal stress UspA family protein